MIQVQNVFKYFGSTLALNDVSFELKKGDIVGFLGQNGAGKTTLMRILTSYLVPSSGHVKVAGEDVVANSMSLRKKIGYLPETPPLYPIMTVKEYLKLAAVLKDVPIREMRSRIDKVLSECDLTGVRHNTIKHLSKGFKQRVGIAQALVNEPDVLILDEPTSGLDPVQVAQFRNLIKKLEYRGTVILSTHILSEIEQIAKRVMILNEGKLVIDEPMDRILQCYAFEKKFRLIVRGDQPRVEKLLREIDITKFDLKALDTVVTVEVTVKNEEDFYEVFFEKLSDNGLTLLEMIEYRPSLEDIFLASSSGRGKGAGG